MTLLSLYQYVFEPKARQPYQNVNRWFQTIVHQPQAIEVLGDFKWADKAVEYDPKKFAQGGKVRKFKIILYSTIKNTLTKDVIKFNCLIS